MTTFPFHSHKDLAQREMRTLVLSWFQSQFIQQHPTWWEGSSVPCYSTTKRLSFFFFPSPERETKSKPQHPCTSMRTFLPSRATKTNAKVNPSSCSFREHSSAYCLHMGTAGELPPSLHTCPRERGSSSKYRNFSVYNHNIRSSINIRNHLMSLAGITHFSCFIASQPK